MTEGEDIQERLRTYSTKTNVNEMNIELMRQNQAVVKERIDEYHRRLHEAEDTLLVIKTIQAIHDTQIQSIRKIVLGNGERETIPMDLARLERSIQDILKVNWGSMQNSLNELDEWKDKVDSRSWQLWLIFITLIITNVVSLILK